MKAVVIRKHGGSEVLEVEERPDPRPACSQVIVKVEACALNHLDIWVRKGLPGIEIPMPHIIGSDIAGVVAEVGSGVDRIRVGEEVVLAPGVSCGRCAECFSGRDNLCAEYTLFGYLIDGGYAEYMAAPKENVLPKPANLDFVRAAAVPLTFLTAWHMLVSRAGLRPGETLLVLAAGSGVGSAAVQIGKLLGATVIAAAGSKEKLDKAEELGADHVVNYCEEDFSRAARNLTGKRGVDVVFEHVGRDTWEKSISSLAPGGRVVTCGATTGYDARLDLRYLFAKHLTVLGSYMGSKAELIEVLRFVERGALVPVVDRVLPLERAAEAHELMEKRVQFGKIVLSVS